jgi:hypothetical protein
LDLRALNRLSLTAGILILLGTIVAIREMHAEERGIEVLLIAGLAIGAFLTIVGLVNVLMEPPARVEEEEEPAEELLPAGRPVSITTAIGAYILVLAVISGIIVGIAADDPGAGIQTFTFGLILGGVIWGLGVLLGHRPVEEES